MQIALVSGSTVSTIKEEASRGRKRLIVRKADMAGNRTGEPFVAVDVGTTTTQIIFSRTHLQDESRPGQIPRIKITELTADFLSLEWEYK